MKNCKSSLNQKKHSQVLSCIFFGPQTEFDGAYVQRLGVSLGQSPHDVGTTQQAVTQPEIKLSSGNLQIERNMFEIKRKTETNTDRGAV